MFGRISYLSGWIDEVKVCFKKSHNIGSHGSNPYYLPSPVLRPLHALSHLTLTTKPELLYKGINSENVINKD